jgi:catechol 2,3-dioxygenase-like lactoylglutathione lyase family enzyme
MTGVFDDASMVSTVLRVRDVAASVAWYREKLGLEPIHVGADGPEHPIAVYTIAGSVVSLWQLPPGQARVVDERSSKEESTSGRSGAARTTSSYGSMTSTATASS